jgi:ElaB/YqjD/DUF883 family membrane-anchored ribosome-binding protein
MSHNKAYQDVKDDLKEAAHDVQEGFRGLREGLSSAAGNMAEAGKAAVNSTRSLTEEGLASARCSASGLLDSAAKSIGRSPMTSVLVAAGIGFLSGFLISRK